MMISQLWKLVPYNDETVLILDANFNDYVVASTHIDNFVENKLGADDTIYGALKSGETVVVEVKMELLMG